MDLILEFPVAEQVRLLKEAGIEPRGMDAVVVRILLEPRGQGPIALDPAGRHAERVLPPREAHRPAFLINRKPRRTCLIAVGERHQIFNDSDEPVRLVAVTSFPFTLNSFNNEDFATKNPFAFTDRYNAEEDHATYSEHVGSNDTVTNLVIDALEADVDAYDHRGKGTTNMHWKMSGNSILDAHVSEMPGGVCPLHDCCSGKKSLEHCGLCKAFPCKTFTDLRDPNMSDAEFEKSLGDRKTALTKRAEVGTLAWLEGKSGAARG